MLNRRYIGFGAEGKGLCPRRRLRCPVTCSVKKAGDRFCLFPLFLLRHPRGETYFFLLTSAMIAVASFSTRGVMTSSPSVVALASRVVLSTGVGLSTAFM